MKLVNELPRADVSLEDLVVFFVQESVARLACDQSVNRVLDAEVLQLEEGQSERFIHHPRHGVWEAFPGRLSKSVLHRNCALLIAPVYATPVKDIAVSDE